MNISTIHYTTTNMTEYEYSFKVSNLENIITFCKQEKFKLISEESQTRELFINESGILARITTKINKENKKTILDFKEEENTNEILKERRESLPIIIEEVNREAIYSMLEILKYKKIKHLVRERWVYFLGNVTFELDKYISPDEMFVVAIEGDKHEVDKLYKKIETEYSSIIIN